MNLAGTDQLECARAPPGESGRPNLGSEKLPPGGGPKKAFLLTLGSGLVSLIH